MRTTLLHLISSVGGSGKIVWILTGKIIHTRDAFSLVLLQNVKFTFLIVAASIPDHHQKLTSKQIREKMKVLIHHGKPKLTEELDNQIDHHEK